MEKLTVELPWIEALLADLGQSPLLGIGCGILITCMIQSSSAGIGILQILAMEGQVSFGAGVYVILGQNIGTCLTTLAAGLGVGRAARSVAWFHLFFNILGAVVITPLLLILFHCFPALAQSPMSAFRLALFHSGFNLLNVLVVYPLVPLFLSADA